MRINRVLQIIDAAEVDQLVEGKLRVVAQGGRHLAHVVADDGDGQFSAGLVDVSQLRAEALCNARTKALE